MSKQPARSDKPETKDAISALTGKRLLFVEYYIGVSNGNGTDAARRAGYAKPMEEAYRLLRNAQIKAAVAQRYSEATMGADEALARLAAQARATLADALIDVEVEVWIKERDPETGEPTCYNAETGEIMSVQRYVRRRQLSLELLYDTGLVHHVAEVSYGRFGPKVKLYDKQGALDKICRGLGIYQGDGAAVSVVIKVLQGIDVDAV